ncbi:MAG: hypothetical protein PHZ23_14760 [Acidiphilium sp.]|nr:hypothetical protein [Acidiphilium sp.]
MSVSYQQGPVQIPPVQTKALWTWDTTGTYPVVKGYPTTGGPTKTGLLPQDLQNFIGIPLQFYGNPPQSILSTTILQWIRWAEDRIEQETNILLTQTWIASNPTTNQSMTQASGLLVQDVAKGQQLGIDYDLADAPYDFIFSLAQDEGWMIRGFRWRPLQSNAYGPNDQTACKNVVFVYPLLDVYFRIPPSWYVEDHQFGLLRLVPAQNVQMLPLFAMQLAFMGFAEDVPGGLAFQYTAGLTANDYNSAWSFMQQLVLCEAAITALNILQGTVNYGATMTSMSVDGVEYKTQYSPNGAFSGIIQSFERQKKELMKTARDKVSGPMITTL